MAMIVLPYLFFAFFLVQQQFIRWEMKEALEQQHLQTITLPAHEVQWIKKGKETIINGRLFDVEKVQEKNGQLSLQGLFDDAETALLQQLDAACYEKNKNSRIAFAQFFQLLSNCFHQWPDEQPVAGTQNLLSCSSISESLPDGYKQLLVPPPQRGVEG